MRYQSAPGTTRREPQYERRMDGMRTKLLGLTMAAVLGIGLAVPAAAVAQETPPPQEPVEVTDELMERFVTIYPTVVEISREAQAELSETEDQSEARQIQAEANERIMGTLEEADLTSGQYQAVIQAVNEDPERMAQFRTLMQEIHGEEVPDGG